MSMNGNFLLVADRDIHALLAEPATIHGWLAARVYEVDTNPDHLDIERAWHALHFLLTGTAWEGVAPLDFIAAGGTALGDEDVGYGPARALSSEQVRELCTALRPLTWEVLRSRFDGRKMAALDIYPHGWENYEPRSDGDGYFSEAFESLVALVEKGSRAGQGMLIWLA